MTLSYTADSSISFGAAYGRTVYDIAAETLPLFDGLSFTEHKALIREEAASMRAAGVTTWAGYRALSRAGSRFPISGRQKRALFAAITAA